MCTLTPVSRSQLTIKAAMCWHNLLCRETCQLLESINVLCEYCHQQALLMQQAQEEVSRGGHVAAREQLLQAHMCKAWIPLPTSVYTWRATMHRAHNFLVVVASV